MSDVMCAIRPPTRLVTAWARLVRRRLVTSVMVVLVIFMHRVQGEIMMMVMRHNTINAPLQKKTMKTTPVPWRLWRCGGLRRLCFGVGRARGRSSLLTIAERQSANPTGLGISLSSSPSFDTPLSWICLCAHPPAG